MKQDQFIVTLEGYASELNEMLARFKKTREGLYMGDGDEGRFREIALELIDLFKDELVDGLHHARIVANYFNDSTQNYLGSPSYRGVENLRGVVNAVLSRVCRSPAALRDAQAEVGTPSEPQRVEALYRIGERFHLVARQLRVRRQGRPTLDVDDEYDVQDLFHALLRIAFDDVRPEEWTPSYAGGAARVDFLLPEIEAVVEIKKSRSGLSARELGEQLIVDIAKYRRHPDCRTLFCFVYDPDGRILNPLGIENDLNANQGDLTVRVLIAP
ncbi:conserved protein of unknown function (plasmid) [Cupriavidus taiwanensis]|uniref:Uncharacterized protein n=1 Tax=Cupriavidus taiwanensis TaxID=164546 RepID=A0A9Q7UY06_9BURK|nr:conserved protein of unknown function [Cupriavidus taiwanensis]